jgi:hypothetical protein
MFLGDEGDFLEDWRHLLGRLGFFECHGILLWLFRRDLRRFWTEVRLLWNDCKFLHSARLLPRDGVNLRKLMCLELLDYLLWELFRCFLRHLFRLLHRGFRSWLRRMGEGGDLGLAIPALEPRWEA